MSSAPFPAETDKARNSQKHDQNIRQDVSSKYRVDENSARVKAGSGASCEHNGGDGNRQNSSSAACLQGFQKPLDINAHNGPQIKHTSTPIGSAHDRKVCKNTEESGSDQIHIVRPRSNSIGIGFAYPETPPAAVKGENDVGASVNHGYVDDEILSPRKLQFYTPQTKRRGTELPQKGYRKPNKGHFV